MKLTRRFNPKKAIKKASKTKDTDPEETISVKEMPAKTADESQNEPVELEALLASLPETTVPDIIKPMKATLVEQSQLFANIVVKHVHDELPDYTSLGRMIANRKGKMYLDFLQNRPGATIAGVYSLRPKPGATVSMPLSWDEVKPGLTMGDFTIHNAIDRLKKTVDLFKGVLGEGIDLAKTIQKAQSIFS